MIEAKPKTIRDAITLTQELGIRYLWVGSLCIVQDDMDGKASLIEMHQVYHSSYLTIIAGVGDHADFSLSGVQSRTRALQSVEEIETGFYLGVLLSYGELLTESLHSCKKHVSPVKRYSSLETKSSFNAAAQYGETT